MNILIKLTIELGSCFFKYINMNNTETHDLNSSLISFKHNSSSYLTLSSER